MAQVNRFFGRRIFSVIQVAAGSAAAATAAFVASALGVAGTVVGAALVSAAITILAAIYDHSMRQARDRIREARAVAAAGAASRPVQDPAAAALADDQPAEPSPDDHEHTLIMEPLHFEDESGYRWGHIAIGALLIFGLAMVGITAFELRTGKPISSIWTGDDTGGTTVGRLRGSTPKSPTPRPVVTETVTQTSQPTPTVTTTVSASATSSTTAKATPQPGATATVTVTVTPTSVATRTASPTGTKKQAANQ